MKKLTICGIVLLLALLAIGCKKEVSQGVIQLGQLYDFRSVTQIDIQNAHNGKTTVITGEKELAEIAAFVEGVTGRFQGSGKGFYEGSYSLKFYWADGKVFLFAFGDSDCFYMGKGDDGYPLRYMLADLKITDDVIPFFSRYDSSC